MKCAHFTCHICPPPTSDDLCDENERLRRELDELGIQFDAARKRLTAAEIIVSALRWGEDARELLDAWDTVPGDEKGRP